MNRAYATLQIRSVSDDAREIAGIATTPTPDRMGDIVEPLGGQYRNPLPLLWQHDARSPVGQVTFGKPTKDGIPFTAKLVDPETVDSPTLKDRLQLAWDSIKSGLVRAVSIGFRVLSYEIMKDGGWKYTDWECLELSAVTIPANAEATITAIRSIDQELRAASGREQLEDDGAHPPRPGTRTVKAISPAANPNPITEGAMPKTIAEQISAFEATRQAKAARMTEIMTTAGEEGVTLDAAQQDEYDGLADEVKSIDGHLERLAGMAKLNLEKAVPARGDSERAGSETRGAVPIVRSAPARDLAKGIAFTRYVLALAMAKGDASMAFEIAKANDRWTKETPDVIDILQPAAQHRIKTAVAAGNTTDSTWAGPLVQYTNLAAEFIEYLRPLTIVGRLNLRPVPFKIKVPRQTAAASVGWVGEGQASTVSKLAFDSVTLDIAKIAGIVVLTDELAAHSSPSAEMLVRDDLAAGVIQFMDGQFVDPSVAAGGSSPASVTNGVTPVTASGVSSDAFRADIIDLMQTFVSQNLGLADGAWIMTQQQALAIGMMQNALGQLLYPTVNVNGGFLQGLPVIASENLPGTGGSPTDGYPIILVKQRDILLADDGGIAIDASREASLQMDTIPDSPTTGATNLISLWQQGMIGIKAVREVNWVKRRSTSVGFIQNAKYQ